MIKEIYNGTVRDSGYMDRAEKEIRDEIEKLFGEGKDKADWQEYREYERHRDKVFIVAAMAEEAGFIEGFRYAAMLLMGCFPG